MAHTLTLDLPDEVFESVAERACQEGTTPARLVTDWISTALQLVNDDPVLSLAGCFESGLGVVGARHDRYLGNALADEMRTRE